MQKHNTVTEARKQIREAIKEDGFNQNQFYLEVEVSFDRNSDGIEVLDLNLNAYFESSDKFFESISLETYMVHSELKKAAKRKEKLSQTFKISGEID